MKSAMFWFSVGAAILAFLLFIAIGRHFVPKIFEGLDKVSVSTSSK